mgnify:FL=1
MTLLGLSFIVLGLYAIARTLMALEKKAQALHAATEQANSIEQSIHQLLPQTQCAQCTYPGCRPYAQAVATGEDHNKCPPGGDALIMKLSELLNREVLPLVNQPQASDKQDSYPLTPGHGPTPAPVEMIAMIREDECIGCAKCIPACPVDAIVGAAKMMHTVILQDCTGCELCLPPCPVDCIDLLPRQQFL